MKRRTWRIYLMILLSAAVLLAVTAMAKETPKKKGPEAVYPEKAFHFKPVLEGTIVSHEFKIQNKGTSELMIQRVKPG